MLTVNTATYPISGTAQANALVTIYDDMNNNNAVDAGEPVVGTQQLSGGATSFSITTSLALGAANNFLATATDASSNESAPANVPTITHTTVLGGTNGGGGGGGGGCSAEDESAALFGWLGVFAAVLATLRGLLLRRKA